MGDEGEDVARRRASSSKAGRAREGTAPRSWASIVAGGQTASSPKGSSIPEEVMAKIKAQLVDSVVIDPETLERCRERWKLTLFGRFLGNGIPLFRLKSILANLWMGIEGFSVSDMQEGYYVFWFERSEDLNYVLANGPWTILGKVLSLLPWRNNFRPSLDAFATAPVWIQLHNLPNEYWELEALIQVAAYFRKPLRMEETTLDHTRSRFARVCIEVNLRQLLKTAVWLGPKEEQLEQMVMYETSQLCATYVG
ncbi:uncharacterized protein [Typha latifolia]|uniref:uncharacterized protein n=1 Tax=Typha latifolia TaxID=4733 RepID=UPI003C2E3141